MDPLRHLSFDVRQLISINEKLQSAALRGTALNNEELEIVRECAKELLKLTDLPPILWTPGYATAAFASNSAGD